MSQHIVSLKTYVAIFAVLLALTATTVAIAHVDLGRLNTVVALVIAFAKALLVALFFMHLRYSSQLTKIVALGWRFFSASRWATTSPATGSSSQKAGPASVPPDRFREVTSARPGIVPRAQGRGHWKGARSALHRLSPKNYKVSY